MRKARRPGQIGNYWLSQRPNSEAWCVTWFDNASRQTRRESTGETDIRAAELKLAEYVTLNARMDKEAGNHVPLETVLVRYYEKHAKTLRSAEAARYALRRWSEFFPGALVSEIKADRQRAFVASMKAEGLSSGYIHRILNVGKAALNRALKEGEIETAPVILTELAPDNGSRDRVLTVAECAALFRAAKAPHLRDYLILAFATGARPEAILELTREQLDFQSGIVRLNPPGRVQNKKRRPTLPLVDALRVFRDRGAGPLVAYNGKPCASIKKSFGIACREAELGEGVTPYTIRHTVATEMRRRGVSMDEVASWLGHSTGYSTTERYVKIGPGALSGATRAINLFCADLGIEFGDLPESPIFHTAAFEERVS